MAREVRSPYPADAIFAVRKGFKAGVYNDYRTFLAQTADYPGGKELWAVFTDGEYARAYVDSGICPVPPLDEKNAPGPVIIPISLPTPDPSPDHENASSLHAYHNANSGVQLGLSATQPPPAPRKPLVVQPEDSDGDTEPEEDFKPPSASLPAQGVVRASQLSPRRPYKSGSITEALKRHASLNSGNTPITQVASPPKPEAPAAPSPFPLTAPVALGSRSTQRVFHSPSKASGSGAAPAPKLTSALAPTPRFAPPISTPVTPLVPELQIRPRPRGEYEQCTHCSGHGWILTPAAQTVPISPPQTDIVRTPPRPRATPTTKLRIFSNSESENSSRSTMKKIQTPRGSHLRVSSVGGVGPERTLKRDWKRTVSDTEMARRSRAISDGTQRKGKGKEKAVEIEVDESGSKSSPFTYDYM